MKNILTLPHTTDNGPNICGHESLISQTMAQRGPHYLPESRIDFKGIQSCFANALHMHQPMIPAEGEVLATARVVSNLKVMMDDPGSGDNYNATVFHDCYKRMGQFIPELVHAGYQPRIMLDYSGALLYGLIDMGLSDVIESLRTITQDPAYRPCVEWLGTAWGHPVAPSTPVQDYRLHVTAWQHYFADLFGTEALSRVRGFSPCEMALPNHPDVAYEFIKTLKDCGYRWILVQEHTIEGITGQGIDPYLPCCLVARNSRGQTVQITAIIKTQGSDTKLVAQMQPYYEAMGQTRRTLAGQSVPALASQIADGENGGVMMNEFPPKYRQVMQEASGTATPPVNVTEYLEYLDTLGITESDLAQVQPVMQHRIWEQFDTGAGPEAMERLIRTLEKQDDRFHMEGGSWTNDISWVHGYESVLGPMQKASALFARKILDASMPTSDPRFKRALLNLMLSQTSCFRYWGEGQWTDYGRELCRRVMDKIN
ncbi:MAG: glycosyl hydrolase family 57 [Phycisphaerae bacterium]|nr:glycosyl hydrolase family 57 [Phycisphaerae bacterium]